jgi:glycosyltransferase involved in cell wall biosynthesis
MQRLHIWCPNIFGFKGGVQVYSRQFIETVRAIAPQCVLNVLLLHDAKVDLLNQSIPKSVNFHPTGGWPIKIRNLVYALVVVFYAVWQRPTLIITTHLNFTPIAYWLKLILGIPFWAVAHGVEAWDIEKSAVKKALKSADTILAVSNYTRHRLIQEQELNPDRVKVLPNTVNPEKFKIAPKPHYLLNRYGLSAEQPIILTVCRLCKDELFKSYDPILKALPIIKQKLPEVHYLLVGKGDDQERIADEVLKGGLEDSVTLTGFVSDEELPDHYNLCDLFALPSKLEGFGIVFLEAMVSGKPALGGNQDGSIDALGSGSLGALINPDDIFCLAETIVEILKGDYPHPLMYQPEALRQTVIDIYGNQQFEQRLGELLKSVLSC